MTKDTLSQGEPWMTPEERQHNHHFVQATTQLLASRGVPETPLILIRINDIIVTWLLARRLETALTPQPGEPAPCPTPTQAGAIGKCRDRLRRAMKDLEACCPKNTAPIQTELTQQLHQPKPAPSTKERQRSAGSVATPPNPTNEPSASPQAPHQPKPAPSTMERQRPAGSVATPPNPTNEHPRPASPGDHATAAAASFQCRTNTPETIHDPAGAPASLPATATKSLSPDRKGAGP